MHDLIVDGEAMSAVEGVDATHLLDGHDPDIEELLRQYVAACRARRDAGEFLSVAVAADVLLARLRLVAALHRLADECGVERL